VIVIFGCTFTGLVALLLPGTGSALALEAVAVDVSVVPEAPAAGRPASTIVADAPDVIVPKEQSTAPELGEHEPELGVTDSSVNPEGTVWWSVTEAVSFGPRFWSVTVHERSSPTSTA
jgi:hypothetical protein